MSAVSSAIVGQSVKPDFDLIETIAESGTGLVDLWEASPIRLFSNAPRTDEIIEILFPGNPLVCCGWSRYRYDTRPRKHWYKLHDLQFVVPNPITARTGLTKTGKTSAHALSNTGERRFLVVEFDFDVRRSSDEARLLEKLQLEQRDVRDLSAALLLHLAETAPLALAVYSGAKSLHGWFYCQGQRDEKVKRFFQDALSLGADNATWTRSQFCRMPDGLRDGRKRQSVYFFNPGVIK